MLDAEVQSILELQILSENDLADVAKLPPRDLSKQPHSQGEMQSSCCILLNSSSFFFSLQPIWTFSSQNERPQSQPLAKMG